MDLLEFYLRMLLIRKWLCMQVVFCWTYLARQICHSFDASSRTRPIVPSLLASARPLHHLVLSPDQQAQIQEVFDLFDTDGGGTIDRSELSLAMVALGFQSKKSIKKKVSGSAVIENIVSDGAVTLDEFNALMMGELSGGDPRETLYAIFAVLSQSSGGNVLTSLITLSKLQAACKDFKVRKYSRAQ